MIHEPLAAKMRPTKLNQIVGQHHLIDPSQPIYTMIHQHKTLSCIFYGPPGIGKTTLAHVMAHELNLPIETFNAAIDKKSRLQKIIKKHPKETFALILDEIHRLTKPIQDFLLPYLESGHILLLGATTANPIITIDPAIRSRCALFELKPVSSSDIAKNLQRAWSLLTDKSISNPKIFTLIANFANGDVRTSINMLETLFTMHGQDLSVKDVQDYAHQQNFIFDRHGNFHYDTISALQKSVRGADTDAALYYTAIMCESGDLETLIRRLKVITYEDIGLADPVRAQQAATALLTARDLGLPEARIPIANAIVLLCTARHSNSAMIALDAASEDAKHHNQYPIPYHLRDTHYSGSQKLGHIGYIYPHDYPNDWIPQQYLPTALLTRQYYQAHHNKSEDAINKVYRGLKTAQLQALKSSKKHNQ